MSSPPGVGLPDALERAASALPADAEAIRPANGDPVRLLERLDAEAAARVLQWLWVHETQAGTELAEAWAEDPGAGAAALALVSPDALPKPARKALRRAQHRLRSQGVALPEPAPREHVARLPIVDDALHAALVTSIDPRGVRLGYLVEPHPAGGARLFQVILDEQRGIVELEVFTTGRSKLRRFLRDATHRERFPAVETEPEALRALIGRHAKAQPEGRPLPRGFAEWRSHLITAAEGAATPGELARAALGDEASPEHLDRAVALVQQGEIGSWPPASDALEALAQRLEEVRKGLLIVSKARQREQADHVMAEGLSEVFQAPFPAHTAAHFEETAYVFWKTGREDEARACLAAARAFRERAPEENPVARAQLGVWLAPVLGRFDEDKSGGQPDEPLLVTP